MAAAAAAVQQTPSGGGSQLEPSQTSPGVNAQQKLQKLLDKEHSTPLAEPGGAGAELLPEAAGQGTLGGADGGPTVGTGRRPDTIPNLDALRASGARKWCCDDFWKYLCCTGDSNQPCGS